MYFSTTSSSDNSKHCVGAAKSSSITGPFIPEDNPMACPLDKGGAIDPAGFTDNGARYVVYKVDGNSISSDSTPIMLQPVNSDGVTLNGDATQLLDRDSTDGPLIEATSLVKGGDTYYLSFSSNMYNTEKYDTSYATATAVAGPYTKAQYPNAPLLQYGDASDFSGPGGSDFSGDGSKILFNA